MITMDKKYRTRDGQDARILCTDRLGAYPVVGLIGERVQSWTGNGRAHIDIEQADTDIIEVVPDVVFYHRMFADGAIGNEHRSHKLALHSTGNASRVMAIQKTTIRNGGQSHADVTVEVLPVDYVEPQL